AMELVEQVLAVGVVAAVEEPAGVGIQLVPALVEAVERPEERRRVGDVNDHGTVVFGAHLPDRVEPRVIDGHQLAVLVAVAEAERFVELESLGPSLETLLQTLRLAIPPVRLVDALEVDQSEGEEPPEVRLVEGGERLLETVAPASVEVDHGANAGVVHHPEV